MILFIILFYSHTSFLPHHKDRMKAILFLVAHIEAMLLLVAPFPFRCLRRQDATSHTSFLPHNKGDIACSDTVSAPLPSAHRLPWPD
jgi:hypothetical protein